MEPIFPGMDPYLEAPEIWPDFHEAFLSYAREALQPILPERYYVKLNTREEIGIGGVTEKVIYPDLAVKKSEFKGGGAKNFARSSQQATVPDLVVLDDDEPFQVSYLEIRAVSGPDQLVTLIELLSPSNKIAGPDREAFERKQKEILNTEVNWVEIDLLREGKRLGCHPKMDFYCRRKGYDYLIVASRSTLRSPRLQLELYGFTVQDPFPRISIPLKNPDPDILLDLGQVFHRAYETGPYRKIIRYHLQAEPPLSPESASWARVLIAARGLIPT